MTAITAPPETAPAAYKRQRWYRRSIVLGLVVGLVGAIAGNLIARLFINPSNVAPDNAVWVWTFTGWAVGFLGGMGAFDHPLHWFLGKPEPTRAAELDLAGEHGGAWRYFRFCTDHKVVGVQYLVLSFVLFAVGGLAAMLIRLDWLQPGSKFFPATTYNTVAGMHGLVMIVATIVMTTGAFGNFMLPIMIGAKDMAFPRLNALSFWLLFAAVPVLLSSLFLGGWPSGWTAYEPLADQAPPGQTAYAVTIIIFTFSSAVAGANIFTTVLTMRGPGLSFKRLPIFVWGTMSSVVLGLIALPAFMASQYLGLLDRTIGTVFYTGAQGGSAWLYEHLFWFMGHPEVYVIILPGFATVLEMLPVFTRKPLFGYGMAVAGIMGVLGFSVIVWAHHMFLTGWSSLANGPFMLTTELISIPTGLVFLVAIGTLWRGKAWTTVPMLYAMAVLWNFIIGGVTGLYLADVPTDVQLHGSLFVTAHFHFTLMGGAVFAFLGGCYYWFPKITGRMFNEKLARLQFWILILAFNVTFFAMFYVGLQGMPRRVADYASTFTGGNIVASIAAFFIGASFMMFFAIMLTGAIKGQKAAQNPWRARSLEWLVPTPVPLENFDEIPVTTEDPYQYGYVEPAEDDEATTGRVTQEVH